MKTRNYLKQNAYCYLYVIAGFLILAAGMRQAVETVAVFQTESSRSVIVIDAGHGGMDGGAVSCTGVSESQINLQIAQRLEKMLALLGYDTVMTRTEDTDLSTEGETVRQKKLSDLRNRVAAVDRVKNPLLVSIHQNHFTDGRYYGPQVFFAADPQSQALAQAIQDNLNQACGCGRSIKPADGVYLMQNISCSGVLVECGFLSNAAEESLLRQAEYQKKLCCVITATLAQYLEHATMS